MLRRMVEVRPNRTDALITLGGILRSKERYQEAVEAYDAASERLGEIKPGHWLFFYNRGIALERSKSWERAEKDFLKALELRPEQPYVLNYLGYSWVEKGFNIERAKKLIGRTAKLEFKLVNDEVNMSTIQGRIDEAKKEGIDYKKGELFSEYLRQLNKFLGKDLPKGYEIAFEKRVPEAF